ncbi:MAG: TetR family transcriptional regulator [Planctomycetes bacterium]|nr:TetR family transcriptional regulator [Planctomycetota bacterium]
MRTLDRAKQTRIIAAATQLFATRRFDQVRLEDVAAMASVGKGTVYLHYKDKEHLYLSLLYEGFSEMVDRLRKRDIPHDGTAAEQLHIVIDELVRFSFAQPGFYELTRRVGVPTGEPKWQRKRRELFELIEQVIRCGIKRGEMHDDKPHLTARYLPSMIRGALLFAPAKLTARALTRHILSMTLHGLCVGAATPTKKPRRPKRRGS